MVLRARFGAPTTDNPRTSLDPYREQLGRRILDNTSKSRNLNRSALESFTTLDTSTSQVRFFFNPTSTSTCTHISPQSTETESGTNLCAITRWPLASPPPLPRPCHPPQDSSWEGFGEYLRACSAHNFKKTIPGDANKPEAAIAERFIAKLKAEIAKLETKEKKEEESGM